MDNVDSLLSVGFAEAKVGADKVPGVIVGDDSRVDDAVDEGFHGGVGVCWVGSPGGFVADDCGRVDGGLEGRVALRLDSGALS